jgi:hypothetical protein
VLRMNTARALSLLVLSLGLTAPGCVSDFNVPGPEQTLWTAELIPELEYPLVSGSGAAVSGRDLTEAGVTMTGLDPGVYAWRVREGPCDDPGEVVGGEGQYPDLVVEEPAEPDPDDDENGSPAVSAQTAPFRGVMIRGQEYHLDVRRGDSGDRVACGNFTRA